MENQNTGANFSFILLPCCNNRFVFVRTFWFRCFEIKKKSFLKRFRCLIQSGIHIWIHTETCDCDSKRERKTNYKRKERHLKRMKKREKHVMHLHQIIFATERLNVAHSTTNYCSRLRERERERGSECVFCFPPFFLFFLSFGAIIVKPLSSTCAMHNHFIIVKWNNEEFIWN